MQNKLIKVKESFIKKAESINTEISGNVTNRRSTMASNAAKKKERLLKYATIADTLAKLWETNSVPFLLQRIKTGADIEHIMLSNFPSPPHDDMPVDGWYRKEYPSLLNKSHKLGFYTHHQFEEAKVALLAFSKGVTVKKDKYVELMENYPGIRSIPSFFPTPDKICNEMVLDACIDYGMSVFEPSAGIGSIIEAIKEYHKDDNLKIFCNEYNSMLCGYVKEKHGIDCWNLDLMEIQFSHQFDRILMNPPFEKLQDAKHIMKCFTALKSGGRLISIAGMGWTFNTSAVAEEFRTFLGLSEQDCKYLQKVDNWLEGATDELTCTVKCLPQGSFKTSFNSTSVETTYIIIDKK